MNTEAWNYPHKGEHIVRAIQFEYRLAPLAFALSGFDPGGVKEK
jgi:hypothetical protein